MAFLLVAAAIIVLSHAKSLGLKTLPGTVRRKAKSTRAGCLTICGPEAILAGKL